MVGYKIFVFNQFQENTVVIWDDGFPECAIVDPGCCTEDDLAEVEGFIAWKGLRPVKILLTHGHFDHIYGAKALSVKYGIDVLMHPGDQKTVTKVALYTEAFGLPPVDNSFTANPIHEGDIIEIGQGLRFEVIETPGHTPGSVCYYCREGGLMLSGDTLFCGSIGRTDLPGGDYDALMKGILEKIMTLPGDILILTGHGPETSVADEAMKNPFLLPFNEPDPEWNN